MKALFWIKDLKAHWRWLTPSSSNCRRVWLWKAIICVAHQFIQDLLYWKQVISRLYIELKLDNIVNLYWLLMLSNSYVTRLVCSFIEVFIDVISGVVLRLCLHTFIKMKYRTPFHFVFIVGNRKSFLTFHFFTF